VDRALGSWLRYVDNLKLASGASVSFVDLHVSALGRQLHLVDVPLPPIPLSLDLRAWIDGFQRFLTEHEPLVSSSGAAQSARETRDATTREAPIKYFISHSLLISIGGVSVRRLQSVAKLVMTWPGLKCEKG